MNIKEQIKAEIERRIRSIESCPFIEAEVGAYDKRNGKLMAYRDLLSFINSLPEEKPSEDLEQAADNHIHKVVDAAGHPGWDWETQDIVDAFKAGAQWQKEQIIGIIKSRITEILGDAQPNSVLRIELQGIIDKIK